MKDFKKLITHHWLLTTVLLLVVLALIFGCKKEPKEIKIGAILPLTGDNAVYGVAIKRGIDLGIEEINKTNGINGKKLVVIFEDDQADPQKSVAAYKKLTTIDKAPLILGGVFSASTLAMAPLAEKDRIVLLSPTSSAVEITNAGDYIFRIYPSDSYDGIFLADYAIDSMKAKTVSIIYLQVTSITAISNVFKDQFESRGGKISSMEGYKEGETDFRAYLLKSEVLNSDVIFIPGYLREMALQLKQAKELKMDKPFLSISTFYDPKILELAKDAAEGVIFSTPFFDPQSQLPQVKSFVDNYKNAYGEIPNIWAGYGYDDVKIAALALEEAGIKPEKIKEQLYQIKNFPGVTGNTTFDKNGDVIKELRIMKVQHGKFLPF